MNLFVQQLINGLSWGAIYALIAVGYTMVYGVLRLINFAHGDVYMIGAMVGLCVSRGSFNAVAMPSEHPWFWIPAHGLRIDNSDGSVVLSILRRLSPPRVLAWFGKVSGQFWLQRAGDGCFGPAHSSHRVSFVDFCLHHVRLPRCCVGLAWEW